MEGSVIDLSKYRYQSAVEDLAAAKTLLNAEQYKASVNRSYYALFHALRAVTALDGFVPVNILALLLSSIELMLKRAYLIKAYLNL